MDDRMPIFKSDAFNCPFCLSYSHMTWTLLVRFDNTSSTDIHEAKCTRCKKASYWRNIHKIDAISNIPLRNIGEIIYPDYDPSIPAEEDMPEDVRSEYEEASRVFSKSPRAAAALLRLGLQKLCKHLGEPGNNINDDLRSLSAKDLLPPNVIKVADTIRITGNQAVHPGEMEEKDIDYIAEKMFSLLNYIVRRAITEPRILNELYSMTPEQPRKSAELSDAKAHKTK